MALNTNTKLDKSFKTLINKEFTTVNREFYEEFGSNTININSSEVWTDILPTTASEAISSGSARLLTQFILTPDPAFSTSVFYLVSGSGFTPGVSTFSGNRNKLQKGFISDKYSVDYKALLYDYNGTSIPEADNINWFFDYSTGILNIQNTGSYTLPYKITVYQYVGKTLNQSLISASSGARVDRITTGSVTASVSPSGNVFTIISGSDTLLIVSGNNIGNNLISGSLFIDQSNIKIGNTTSSVIIPGNVNIGGNLNVNGNVTFVSSSILQIEDNFILIASGSNTDTDGGLIVQRNSFGLGYGLGYNALSDRWAVQKNISSSANSIIPDSYILLGTQGPSGSRPTGSIYGNIGYNLGSFYFDENNGDAYIYI